MNIKPELKADYETYAGKNTDPYGAACIKAGKEVMRLLDEGKSPEEAEKGLYGHDLTGFMAGVAISGVVKFHQRGDEMKAWWNRNTPGTPDDMTGTNNPAIITISDNPPLG